MYNEGTPQVRARSKIKCYSDIIVNIYQASEFQCINKGITNEEITFSPAPK
ncbi:hypothetical protein BMS3Abin06_01202 [bacterium BMS3Abin06]|nr:hypothetical protein BMS3Abin06_01202 [bacterium BMS3Abin06]